ncbi:rubrerythrin [Clostridium rectalis]|uniref:rubrerythrin n=1 Tax=Clostridium rectalis TaxID=2040295 RepID=UPI000F63F302|nr:rubrerythrin family protein [Clostridium rectalis]
MNLKGSKTEQNLYKTFAGESRARNKYTFYGEKARMEGYEYIASVFEETAGNEKAHAREVFKRFLGLVKSTKENLKDAAEGEAFESSKLYKDFERVAREEGFEEIADFYKELAEVEEDHERRFNTLYERVNNGTMFKSKKDSMWQCMNCGYIHVGKEAPAVCPLCKFPRAYFKPYCINYREE